MVGISNATTELKSLPKKFYAAAGVQQDAAAFSILLDGKPVKTPQQNMLQCDSRAVAEAIAAEWAGQEEVIDPATMPLTRLLSIAIDRVPLDRALLLDELTNYAGTDLLCYRQPKKDNDPVACALRAKQNAVFNPILKWSYETYGITLKVTEGITPIAQDNVSIAVLAGLFAQTSDAELAALSWLLPILGSAILVLAVWKHHLTINAALAAARLDEDAQAAHWGHDADTAAAWQGKEEDARAAAFFLSHHAA